MRCRHLSFLNKVLLPSEVSALDSVLNKVLLPSEVSAVLLPSEVSALEFSE